MSVWFEKSRPALLEALNNVCKQIDGYVLEGTYDQAILEPGVSLTKSQGITQHPNSVDNSAIANDAISRDSPWEMVMAENQRLRDELIVLRKISAGGVDQTTQTDGVKQSHPEPVLRKEVTSTAAQESKDWKTEYHKVALRYNALADNFKIAKTALERRKGERDKWIAYADELVRRIQNAEKTHHILILGSSSTDRPAVSSTPQPINGSGYVSTENALQVLANQRAPDEDRGFETYSSPHYDGTGRAEDNEPENTLPALRNTAAAAVQVDIKQEPSSDGPVVISERILKKRKQDDDIDAPRLRRVKLEEGSDQSPIISSPQVNSSQQESSLDLGNVTNHMETPRKRKETGGDDSIHIYRDRDTARTNLADIPPFHSSAPRLVRVDHTTSALTPLSVNRRLAQPQFQAGEKQKDKLSEPKLRRAIATLAEDGQRQVGTTIGNHPAVTPVHQTRLSALLNEPSIEEESPLMRVGRRYEPESPAVDSPFLNRRELPFEKSRQNARQREGEVISTPASRGQTLRTPLQSAKGTRSHKKTSTPILRTKPISELRLSDFKVNPQANEGHDFAFSDVVRDKDERACLSGCTDMHCCGKEFRALAESMRPNPPLTTAQRQEEQKLLEDHLGDYCYRLASMGKNERDELWLVAKTEELANKYGKHRHRFSRMRSPPGFWNTDFPNTQEMEAEKAEAAKREKAAIQGRYREAMKAGGKWMFRDE